MTSDPLQPQALHDRLLALVRERGTEKSICPSEVPRSLVGEQGPWRPAMATVRTIAANLARDGVIDILRKGKRIDPDAMRGVIRLRLASSSPARQLNDPSTIGETMTVSDPAAPDAPMTPALEQLAHRLWQARQSGTTITISDAEAPATVSHSYQVQDAMRRLTPASVVGFKVGSTSAEAQRILGTDEPGWGYVYADTVFEAGSRVPVFTAHGPMIEGEFLLRLGADLPARDEPYSADDVADAVDAVAGAVEVVGSRLDGGLSGQGRERVSADGGANIALVHGAWCSPWRHLDLAALPASVTINGAAGGMGEGRLALGSPLNVLAWLANARARGGGDSLKRGQIITTGTCTGIDKVAPGDTVTAAFGPLGSFAFSFVSRS